MAPLKTLLVGTFIAVLVLQQGERPSAFPQTQSNFFMKMACMSMIKFNGIYSQSHAIMNVTALDLQEYTSLHMSCDLFRGLSYSNAYGVCSNW